MFVEHFETESGRDQLKFYDGKDDSSSMFKVLEGNPKPQFIKSNGNKLFIRFTTSYWTSFKGFDLSYKSIVKGGT